MLRDRKAQREDFHTVTGEEHRWLQTGAESRTKSWSTIICNELQRALNHTSPCRRHHIPTLLHQGKGLLPEKRGHQIRPTISSLPINALALAALLQPFMSTFN